MEPTGKKQQAAWLAGLIVIAGSALAGSEAALSAFVAFCAYEMVETLHLFQIRRIRRLADPKTAAAMMVRLRWQRMLAILAAFALGVQVLVVVGQAVGAALLAGLAAPLIAGETYMLITASRN
ncbi:MAG: hypothetical protein OXC81_03090 [Betaproteobacteria bacterium]|nr:hypothetical protein [Betaproteobacteria bacterium]